jgi:hypothetical protein
MSILDQIRREGLFHSIWILIWWRGLAPFRKRLHHKRCARREARLAANPAREWQPAKDTLRWYSPSFYLSAQAQEQLATRITQEMPEAAERIRLHCDAILAGDYSWLMENAHKLGQTPDWHGLVDQAGSWPLIPSDQIDYIGAERPGDVRRIWELNRHQYLITLSRGWRVFRDERYASCLARHLNDWIERNPFEQGVNWTQGQEAALRAISWCWIWHLCHDAPQVDQALREKFLLVLARSLRFMERHLCAFGRHTHNHLISELGGLYLVARFFPFLPEAARLEAWSRKLLQREILKQVFPDGLAGELSTNYMLFVLDTLCGVIAADVDFWRGSRCWKRVSQMGEASSRLTRPDGSLPFIGDNDSGRGWLLADDLLNRESYAQLPWILEHKAVSPWTPDQPAEVWLWLFGPELAPCPHSPREAAFLFRDGGIWTWREHEGADASWLLFRGGATKRLQGVMQSHHHADMLSLELAWRGRPLLVDPGTYAYSLEDDLRLHFRGSSAHSGLWVEGRESVNFGGKRFGVWDLPDSELLASGENWIQMACSWKDVHHERRVNCSSTEIRLEDTVSRPAGKRAALALQLAAGTRVEQRKDGWYLPGHNLSIRLATSSAEPAGFTVEEALVSRRYAHKETAPLLRLELPAVDTWQSCLLIVEGDSA